MKCVQFVEYEMNLANLSGGKPTATLWQRTRIFYESNYKAYALELHMQKVGAANMEIQFGSSGDKYLFTDPPADVRKQTFVYGSPFGSPK